MEVGVVIPLFNGAAWIGESLSSVFGQSKAPKQVVVVDDGSSDDSLRIVRGFPSVTVLRSPGQGPNAARNHGAEHVAGTAVAFLDQDDVWHPDHLAVLGPILHARPECPAVVAGSREFQVKHDLPAPRAGDLPCDPWEWFPFDRIPTPSCVLIRRSALERAGPWLTAFPATADYYMWLLLSLVRPLRLSRAVTVGRRSHLDSYSFQLRRSDARAYLQEKVSASHSALAERERAGAAPTRNAQARLAALDDLHDVLTALETSDERGLPRAALRLESNLRGESPQTRRAACELLLWLLCAEAGSDRRAGEISALELLLDQWPRAATEMLAALRYTAKRAADWRSIARALRAHPDRRDLWVLAGDALRIRAQRRLDSGGTRLRAWAGRQLKRRSSR